MALEIRPYREEDLAGMLKVWNEVVEGGEAFPQIEPLTLEKAAEFFAAQTLSVVAGNAGAIHLYEDLGFVRVGTVPGGFVNFMGGYEDIHIYYRDCVDTRRPC